jgi:hypothetical protein
LYKENFLKKSHADLVNHMMKYAFSDISLPENCEFAVLDIKENKLYELDKINEDHLLLL